MSLLPDEFKNYFAVIDITDSNSPSLESFSVLTIDADGWPRAAQLSFGEILFPANDRIRVALWPDSRTSENIKRNQRAILTFAWSGAVATIRCRSISPGDFSSALQLTLFEFEVQDFQIVRAPYARVESGLRFSVYDKSKVIERWQRQRSILKSFFEPMTNSET